MGPSYGGPDGSSPASARWPCCCALLVGAPIALLAFAGNPLPDHLPTISEVGTALTSRDDGQLFLRALAVAGWFGWATFAFSVLVELGAQALRRPAPKLPGMGRQQRAAAALVGSVALILVASPAAASAAAVYGTPAYATGAPASPPWPRRPALRDAGHGRAGWPTWALGWPGQARRTRCSAANDGRAGVPGGAGRLPRARWPSGTWTSSATTDSSPS